MEDLGGSGTCLHCLPHQLAHGLLFSPGAEGVQRQAENSDVAVAADQVQLPPQLLQVVQKRVGLQQCDVDPFEQRQTSRAEQSAGQPQVAARYGAAAIKDLGQEFGPPEDLLGLRCRTSKCQQRGVASRSDRLPVGTPPFPCHAPW